MDFREHFWEFYIKWFASGLGIASAMFIFMVANHIWAEIWEPTVRAIRKKIRK